MPPTASPTDELRAAIRANRARAAYVPGLASILDKLDAYLSDRETRFQYLERAVQLQARDLTVLECQVKQLQCQVKQLQGMGGAVDELRAGLIAEQSYRPRR